MEQAPQITLEDALKNIKSVCSQFKGTLQDHSAIQESLKVIEEHLKDKKEGN